MITGLIIALSIVSVLLIIGIVIIVMMFRATDASIDYTEELEEVIFNINIHMNQALISMKDLDVRGAFEADDEVGEIYKQIKKIIFELSDIVPPIEEETTNDEN